jgi:hypothetical protein
LSPKLNRCTERERSSLKQGVAYATQHCADRYLERIFDVSGAKVVILVGSTVLSQFTKRFRSEINYGRTEKITIGQREYMFASVYHNNARFAGIGEKRKETLENIRQPLRDYLA